MSSSLDQTTPLNPTGKKLNADDSNTSPTLSRTAKNSIIALGVIRVVTGASCLFAPIFVGRVFSIAITPQTSILARLFAAREIVLGELLLTADRGTGGDKRELKRALWAGVATDAVDVGSCVFALATRTMSTTGAGLLGGGAAVAIALGAVGLRSL